MKIIAISGLDGSGKSTQIRLLQNYFEKEGRRVMPFHAVQFSIANVLTKKTPTSAKKGRQKTTDVTSASPATVSLRKIALRIDVSRFHSFVADLKKEGYDYLLTDRYFYDMIVNIAYLSKKMYNPPFFEKIIVPRYKFYLAIDPKKIMQRANPPEQGIHYLYEKQKLFRQYQNLFNLTNIDGDRSQQEIFEEILSTIH